MSRSRSSEPSGKNGIADGFWSIKRSSAGESEIVLAAEYKPPQKLPVSLLVAALDNTTEINLDTGIIDEDDEEFGPKQLVAAVITQLFSALAIQAPKPTKEWEIAASELPIWKLKRVDIQEKISRIAEQPCEEADSHSPGMKPVSSTHHSPDEVDHEEEASGCGSKTGKELPHNKGMHRRPDSRQDVFDGLYCTHECGRGLTFGGPLDEKCPNVKDHGSKHVGRQEFLRLMREQLKGKGAHDHCKPINASGHIGHLFKVRLLPHSYTLVAKAVAPPDWRPLIHEEKMYNHLRDLQGRFVPVCPGRVELNGLFRCKEYRSSFGCFQHFLFLSYAGKPVLKALPKFDDSIVSQVLATLAQLHQRRVIHRDAAPRNMLYDGRTGRYMVIDLEMSKQMIEEVPQATHGGRKKRKIERELKTASKRIAAESR
ncbi:hypothetical protein E4U39_004088 [Claviceps sp. Clav50 group G5]|nr:hypothetical protein E4U39_004088 [Claviceps sp. Clav50 group G5]